jgi:DNA invertase Pin-like site-specific DNA recombinase
MMQRARDGVIQAIIVWKKDRITRRSQYRRWLYQELDDVGCEFISIRDPREIGVLGDLKEDFEGHVSEQEVKTTNERMVSGRVQTARAGRLPSGAGATVYGYNYVKDYQPGVNRTGIVGRREINEAEAEWVREIFRLFVSGWGPSQIARHLNDNDVATKRGTNTAGRRILWQHTTVKQVLVNRNYIGDTVRFTEERFHSPDRRNPTPKTGKLRQRPPIDASVPVALRVTHIPIAGFTPAIVDEATFTWAQRLIENPPTRRSPKATLDYLLTGHLRCGKCGLAYCGCPSGGKNRTLTARYSCSSVRRVYGSCHNRTFDGAWLETVVWEALANVLARPESLLTFLDGMREDMGQAPDTRQLDFQRAAQKKKQGEVERLTAKLGAAQNAVVADALMTRLNLLGEEIAGCEREIAALEAVQQRARLNAAGVERVRERLVEIAANWSEGDRDVTYAHLLARSYAEKAEMLALFAIEVTVAADGGSAEIAGYVPQVRIDLSQSGMTSTHTHAPRFHFSLPFPARLRSSAL